MNLTNLIQAAAFLIAQAYRAGNALLHVVPTPDAAARFTQALLQHTPAPALKPDDLTTFTQTLLSELPPADPDNYSLEALASNPFIPAQDRLALTRVLNREATLLINNEPHVLDPTIALPSFNQPPVLLLLFNETRLPLSPITANAFTYLPTAGPDAPPSPATPTAKLLFILADLIAAACVMGDEQLAAFGSETILSDVTSYYINHAPHNNLPTSPHLIKALREGFRDGIAQNLMPQLTDPLPASETQP